MIAYEKTIKKERIFSGRVLTFDVDTVELPDGTTGTRELVYHPGGVGVVAVDDGGCVYMVRQFRKPYEEVLLEIPAGKLEKGEEPLEAAKRELAEETGVTCRQIVELGEFYPSVGYTNENLRLFLAKVESAGEASPDEDEYLDVSLIPLKKLKEMIMSGEIKDGKTIAAILKAAVYLNM